MNSTPPPSFQRAIGFDGQVDRWQEFEYVAPASVLQWGGGHAAGTGGRENRDKGGGMVSVRGGISYTGTTLAKGGSVAVSYSHLTLPTKREV